jgi:hypothetical protein
MEIIVNKYKKVSDFCYELFGIAELQLYNTKFSNRIYSNFQKLFLLVYKQFRKFTYEELLTDLEDNSSLKSYLGFKKLPHYSTLIKFAKTLPTTILDKLLIAFARLIPIPKRVVIDSTGISLDNASPHYCKRIGLPYKKRPYLKTSLVFDIDNYFILLCKTGKSKRHDTKDAKLLIKKLAKTYDEIEILYGDRGYDDEKIFKMVFEILGAYPLILQRRMNIDNHRRKGHYRKKTFKIFDYGEYLQRNKGETGNSILKKRFSANIKSKVTIIQKRDLFIRIIAYNIDRLLRTGKEAILIIIRIVRISQEPRIQ